MKRRRKNNMLNKIVLVGRLTKEIETFKNKDGVEFGKTALAINSRDEYCEFIDILLPEYVLRSATEYLHKGDKVAITGKLFVRKYEKNGENRVNPQITVEELEFIDLHADAVEEEPVEAPTPKKTSYSKRK